MVSVNFVVPFTRLLNHRRRIVCISESLTLDRKSTRLNSSHLARSRMPRPGSAHA